MSVRITGLLVAEAVGSLDKIMKLFVFPYITPDDVEKVKTHLAYVAGLDDINVKVRIETIPELQLTRVIVEFTPSPLADGPVKQ